MSTDTITLSPALLEHVRWAEGFEAEPYLCPAGHLTIGYGTNIEIIDAAEREYLGVSSGREIQRVTRDHAEWLLEHRLRLCIDDALLRWPWMAELPARRRDAVYDMAYNMGVPTLAKFRRTLAALERHDWNRAADEATDSLWYRQVGRRGPVVVRMIREG